MAASRSCSWRGACRHGSRSCADGRSRCRRAATTASTSETSPSITSPRTRMIQRAATWTRCGGLRCRSSARSRTGTCRPSASGSSFTSSRGRCMRPARSRGRCAGSRHTYEKDGALCLRTTDFGDDKDRVMRKRAEKGGDYTYFLPDVAYHVDKWERGFTRAINVQGADHHSTVTRVRIGLQALEMGISPGYPEYVLHQMVTVMQGGAEMKISKRAGSYMTVRELVDEVGRDAVRYFFLMRRGDSHLVFDVDLAKSQTEENPVFYVQMAHARMSGIFRVAGREPASVQPEKAD